MKTPIARVLVIAIVVVGCRERVGDERVEAAPTSAVAAGDPAPALLIGREDGADEYLFDDVRDIAIADDNTLLVTDRSSTIRAYDSTGTWLRTIGRRGRGPGEYQEPYLVALHGGGRIQVYDGSLRRLTEVEETGSYVTSTSVGASGTPVGSGGGILWLENLSILRSGESTATYVAVDLVTGTPTSTFRVELPTADVSEAGGMVTFRQREPWRRPVARACGASLCLVLPPADTVWRVSPSGQRTVAGRLPRRVEMGPRQRPDMVSDEEGRLWVSVRAEDAVTELVPVRSAGESLSVALPAAFRPHRITNERVVGVQKTPSGVELVAVYRLPKRD